MSGVCKPIKAKCIILEGPECVGKTTHALLLQDKYNAILNKRVSTPDPFLLLNNVTNDISDMLIRRTSGGIGERLIIYDRWQFISDIIYNRVYNSKSIFEPIYYSFLDAMRHAGMYVIYLRINEKDLIKRFNVRGDNLVDLDTAIKVRDAYDEFFESTEGKSICYKVIDVSGRQIDTVSKELIQIINNIPDELL